MATEPACASAYPYEWEQYRGFVAQSYTDLELFSGLHPDFIEDCLVAIEHKKQRADGDLLGELFPHVATVGLALPENDRRRLAAAWTALYGYSCIVDAELDRKGYLSVRSSLAAGNLLSWGINAMSEYTTGTEFAGIFTDNINRAFSAQYHDLRVRELDDNDRTMSDADKNRAMVAMIAAQCAASHAGHGLVQATESILAGFQCLDDLLDVEDDLAEGNRTLFVRIVEERAGATDVLDEIGCYSLIVRDDRFDQALAEVRAAIKRALPLLEPQRDSHAISFLRWTDENVGVLIASLQAYRNGGAVTEPELFGLIKKIANSS